MRLIRAFVILLALSGAMPLHSASAAQPQPQDEFVPLSEIPPEEQLPAAPMVIAAYAFVWVAVLVYVISLVKRLDRVEADLRALEHKDN
ncbi:MAG: CcmD family protein [Acidobacteriota bacterium]